MGGTSRYDSIDDKTHATQACDNRNVMKKNKLKKINLAQFYIQLVTATIFGYMSIRDADVLKMMIAILLLLSWGLGYWRHLIVRRRINNNVNPWTRR